MSFGGLQFTNRGLALQAKGQTGTTIQFTRIAVGDGYLGGSTIADLTALKNQIKTLSINKLTLIGSGQAVVGAALSNQDLGSGFYWREIGVFANDPDVGEILYCYGNAGNNAEWIPAGGGPDILEKQVDVISIVGNAQNVSAIINQSLVFATKTEFDTLKTRFDTLENDVVKQSPAALTLDPSNQVKSVTDSTDGLIDAEIGGATLNNAPINGDFANGTTGWTASSATGFTVTSKVAKFTATAGAGRISTVQKISAGNKYFISAKVKANSNLVSLNLSNLSDHSVSVNHSGNGNSEILYTIADFTGKASNDSGQLRIIDGRTSGWAEIEIDGNFGVYCINITALGLGTLTDAQVNYMLNTKWFSGFQGSSDVEIEVNSLNIFNPSDATQGGYIDANTGGVTVAAGASYSGYMPVKPSTQYYTNIETGSSYALYDRNKKFISGGWTTPQILSMPANARFMRKTVPQDKWNQFMVHEGNASKPYEAGKGKKLTIKGFTRHRVPDGTQDWLIQKWGYTWAIRNIKEKVLQASDITAIVTTNVNNDYVYTGSIFTDIYGAGTADTLATKGMTNITKPRNNMAGDDPLNIWTHSFNASNGILIFFPKGTYANLAAAQAALAGTKVLYRTATPQQIPFEDFGANGIEVIGALPSFDNYTQLSMVSSDITPTVTTSYSRNMASSVDRNTQAIAGLLTLTSKHEIRLDALDIKLSTSRLNKDLNGLYTEIQFKRKDGTLFKKSVLSGGTSPKYTTRTETFYAADGVTVIQTDTYTLTYTGNDLTSEVITP
jgi:hypothetical protein